MKVILVINNKELARRGLINKDSFLKINNYLKDKEEINSLKLFNK